VTASVRRFERTPTVVHRRHVRQRSVPSMERSPRGGRGSLDNPPSSTDSPMQPRATPSVTEATSVREEDDIESAAIVERTRMLLAHGNSTFTERTQSQQKGQSGAAASSMSPSQWAAVVLDDGSQLASGIDAEQDVLIQYSRHRCTYRIWSICALARVSFEVERCNIAHCAIDSMEICACRCETVVLLCTT
jgi:hypothetical protein